MKRLSTIMMCLLAMMAASLSAKAQEVTITLWPGWTWISIPSTETMDFATALGSFTPAVGDMIKSQWGNATYRGNGEWRGQISEFYPGYGYKYYSTRQVPVSVTFNAQQPTQQVVVTTDTPQFITAISAIGGGEVTTTDGTYILVKGLCWATHENPTTNDDFFQEAESGVGTFSVSMTGLNISTTYYVRAYAVTPNGTVYGDQKTFTTQDGIPILTTAEVTNIGNISAICGGTIISDGGLTTTRGVCWSTSQHPTVTDSHSNDGYGIGSFESQITGLTENTTYYVRAYASNSNITVYGDEVSFTTFVVPTGAINGKFTINGNNDQVYFSQGNLQYIGSAATPYWKFANNQWDILGTTTGQNSSDENVDRDLFGWGTSGYNHGANCYQPWSTSQSNSDYYAYGSPQYNLYDQTGQADWGYNPISNGGNQANQWRTLTMLEWAHIFHTRTTSSGIRYAKANVNNVNGVILLPDDWSTSYYTLSNTNSTDASFSSNTISATQWATLEQHGAVFLPAAGNRNGTSVVNVGSGGFYWSTLHENDGKAYGLLIYSSILSTDGYYSRYDRWEGFSVRLVRVAQ